MPQETVTDRDPLICTPKDPIKTLTRSHNIHVNKLEGQKKKEISCFVFFF